ncbi:uncharacterized protein LOC132726177 [Ruditapes philippinarum]|uniref:uncharacterized protein LOC132726177 n=1 Tax=Ruditapes philippinarum TaxID=129788 RepID=UPI00295C00ED|nr:uncharacterized protein LOC132726177 [Ruditapes philippinarum]
MAVSLVLNVFLIFSCICCLVHCECPRNGTCCDQFQCEYSLYKKLIELESKLGSLEIQLEESRNKIEKVPKSGSTYVRWGRTTCRGDSKEVYNGYAAGSHHAEPGGAANALCLTKSPKWGQYTSTVESGGAFIYGAEYSVYMHTDWKHLQDHDVPCVVCQVPRSDILMVPGSNICPTGYKIEYNGYLMAGHTRGSVASEYLCVDSLPEKLYGGDGDKTAKVFCIVQAICGSLKCPPYVNGRELTCAVCSR